MKVLISLQPLMIPMLLFMLLVFKRIMERDLTVLLFCFFIFCPVHSSLLHCLGFACCLGKVTSSTDLSWNDKRFERFSKCPVQDSSAFRVASFNILAPEYARTAEAQYNFFRYCPSHILNFSYRLPLIIKELLSLECDIIGLQEW
jgi:hypothetical protein